MNPKAEKSRAAERKGRLEREGTIEQDLQGSIYLFVYLFDFVLFCLFLSRTQHQN